MIEVGKFYRTRNGCKAICIGYTPHVLYPYKMAYLSLQDGFTDLVNKEGFVDQFDDPNPLDIVGEWAEPEVAYLNIYRDFCHMYDTAEEATRGAGPTRVACVRIEYQRGQNDAV